ncbi:MAG: VanZ family protein [Candidatus Scalindua sp.]
MYVKSTKEHHQWFRSKSFLWSLIICYVVLIYSTLYIMRPILNFLKMTLKGYLDLGVGVMFLIILSLVLAHIISNRERYSVSQYLWFLFICCLYGLVIYILELPEEQVHFIEYGILSALIYLALTHDINNRSIYFLSSLIVFVFGTIDEAIQWLLPNRVFDIRDLVMNGTAGILVQLLIAMVISKRKSVLVDNIENA